MKKNIINKLALSTIKGSCLTLIAIIIIFLTGDIKYIPLFDLLLPIPIFSVVIYYLDNLKNKSKQITKIDENDSLVKWFISNFGEDSVDGENWRNWQLHLIETQTLKDKVIVTITLSRPGMLIGKAGRTINNLTTELTSYLRKPTEIKIKEFDPFN